ncbi:MAG: LuxR C-terminal-related transcriptional regulator [Umezawaea sp.]
MTRLLIDRSIAAAAPGRAGPGVLTPRETTVLTHLATGLSNAEIAAAMGLRSTTVKDHVAAIYDKLGVHNRVQAAVAAYDSGLVHPRAY